MGSGTHGGFGHTAGSQVRFRKGHPRPEIVKDLSMALNPETYAQAVADKYNIHMKGSGYTIKIVYDPFISRGRYGKTSKDDPFQIHIGPDAFISEEELANTIAHELNHARDFIKGGSAPENRAYKSGNALAEYIRGER